MSVILLGVNHKSAPIDVREKLAFDKQLVGETIEKLILKPEIKETAIISTCNRVELYANVPNVAEGLESLKNFIYEFHNIDKGQLEDHFFQHYGKDAINHLFMVSSSLDSMVVGEPQILGQVKDAYMEAKSRKATGMILNQLFEKAFSAAKKVRTETKIAESAVSISYTAVELARKIFGDLVGKTVMIIGAGEMAEIAAQHLLTNGVKGILVCNRTFERAVDLAEKLNGSAIRFDAIEDELQLTDIIINSAAAPNYIIKKSMMDKVMHARKHKPMFFIDIAVPRALDPAINKVDNVYLYDIDDMQSVIDTNKKEREKEAKKAEEIVQRDVNTFLSWMDTLEVVPTITALRDKAEAIRKKELEKTLSKIDPLSDELRKSLDKMTSSMMNQFLHGPTVTLKKHCDTSDGQNYVKLIRNIFKLDEEK